MKLVTIVENLKKAGVDIQYRVRKDGGILVTDVNGLKFKGAAGNTFVRNLTGETLSESQIKQRLKIKPPKGKSAAARKMPELPEDTIKKIKRLQREYRKQGKEKGYPSIRNYRYNLKKYGKEKADEMLAHSEQYIRGLAYDESIDALILRLDQINNVLNDNRISELIELTKQERDYHREDFTEEKISFLIQAIYDFEKEWKYYAEGLDSNYADEDSIINDFYFDFKTTLQARYSRTRGKKMK